MKDLVNSIIPIPIINMGKKRRKKKKKNSQRFEERE